MVGVTWLAFFGPPLQIIILQIMLYAITLIAFSFVYGIETMV